MKRSIVVRSFAFIALLVVAFCFTPDVASASKYFEEPTGDAGVAQYEEISFEGYISIDGRDSRDCPDQGFLVVDVSGKRTVDINQHLIFHGLKADKTYIAEMQLSAYSTGQWRASTFETVVLKIHDGVVDVVKREDGSVLRTYQMNPDDNSVDIVYENVDIYGWQTYEVNGALTKKLFGDEWNFQLDIPWDAATLDVMPNWLQDTNKFKVVNEKKGTWSRVEIRHGKNGVFGSQNKIAELSLLLPIEDNEIISDSEEIGNDIFFFIEDNLFTDAFDLSKIAEGTELICTGQIIDITDGGHEVVATKTYNYKYTDYSAMEDFPRIGAVGWMMMDGDDEFQPLFNHTYALNTKVESKDELFIDGKWQKLVLEHNGVDDKAQTFTIKRGYLQSNPYLHSTAKVDGSAASADSPVQLETHKEFIYKDLTDSLDYKIQAPGIEYIVRGKLIDRTDGDKVVATNEFRFTPRSRVGSIDNEFKNVGLQRDHKYVFTEEMLSTKSFEVGFLPGDPFPNTKWDHVVHDNLDDLAQSISVVGKAIERPESTIDTKVRVEGVEGSDKALQTLTIKSESAVKTVVDDVLYKGLFKGESYTVTGELYDITAKKTLSTNSVKFTPENTDGSLTMTFKDVTLNAGHTYVVFETIESENEYLFRDGSAKHIIEHKDSKDLAQSFKVVKKVDEIPKKQNDREAPNTGDPTNSQFLFLISLIATGLIAGSKKVVLK